jgi:putative transcriptional regulator
MTAWGISIRNGAAGLLGLALLLTAAAEAARPPTGAVPRDPQLGEPLTGLLLVATPDLQDPNFDHTVVYVVQHDDGGAMGLVVNRVLGRGPIGELLEGLGLDAEAKGAAEIAVHYGGPVERGRGFILHSPDFKGADTVVLSELAALTSSLDVLSAIAAGDGPRHALFALGYAGWAPDQLESELAAGAWVVVDPDEALLFDDQVDSKWQRALDRQGIDL